MRNYSMCSLRILVLALILACPVTQSCRTEQSEGPSYLIKKNLYYRDLIGDIASKGKIDIAHMNIFVGRQDSSRKQSFVFSQDIQPVEMEGANKFSPRYFDLLMQTSGTVSQKLLFPEGENEIIVQARGTILNGETSKLRLKADDTELGVVDVRSELDKYVFPLQLKKGWHQIGITFLNGDGQRSLLLKSLQIKRVIIDYHEFIQEYMVTRRQDDSLNEVNGEPSILMGKIGSVSRRSLFLPPPACAEVMSSIPQKATLQFAIGIDEYVWRNHSCGCQFQASFVENDKKHILYQKKLQPFKNKRQRKWQEVKIDLSRFQNRKGILRFESSLLSSPKATDQVNLGYLLLANPRITSLNQPKEPNIILVSIDTLRRDHLGIYGYKKETSPFLDATARESAVFDKAIAQAPYTVTSHMTMMTSLWPSVHQILTHEYEERLSPNWLTLPQILKGRGYMTAGFTGGGQVSAVYGFDRGMDIYDDQGGRTETIFLKAIQWIRKVRGSPFFLFLHTYDVHMPYDPPPPYDTIFNPDYKGTVARWTDENVKVTDPELFQRILDLYDGEIRYVDSYLQQVVQFLKEKGLYENTMLLITSDHGEEFMERGTMAYHGHTLYNELLSVPLIIKFPYAQWAGQKIQNPVALTDLMPTVLNYLKIPVPPHCQGRSLLAYLQGTTKRDQQRQIFSERIAIRDDPRVDIAVQTSSEKYTQRLDAHHQYFNLADDPGEQNDLWESHTKNASVLAKRIQEYISSNAKLAKFGLGKIKSRRRKVDEGTLDKLKALGYIK